VTCSVSPWPTTQSSPSPDSGKLGRIQRGKLVETCSLITTTPNALGADIRDRMDRRARNLDALRKLVLTLTQRGIQVHFVKESLTFRGRDSPMAMPLLSMLGTVAEFERSMIRER